MLESLMLAAAMYAPMNETVPTPPPVVATKSDPNQTGVQPSAYTGKFYLKGRFENYRKCIGQREGRFQYWGTGNNGRYQSTYQMTHALVRGAAWMMYPEMKKWWGTETAKQVRDTLLSTKGSHWSRFYMDMAFYTILSWDAPGSGAHHWAGGRFSCTVNMKDWGGLR